MFLREGKSNWYYLGVVAILAVIVGGGGFWLLTKQEVPPAEPYQINDKVEKEKEYSENDKFRNQCIKFVREVAGNYFEEEPIEYPEELEILGNWEIEIIIYSQGEIKGKWKARSENEILSLALEEVTKKAVESLNQFPFKDKEKIGEARFFVSFSYLADQPFSFIEYQGEGREFIQDLVITRYLDKNLLLEKINKGKDFLFFAENKEEHGFYKKYETLNDNFGDRVHTVYSASIIYTLLKIYDFDKDERILKGIPDWGDFLLSMQNKEEKEYGAFHYSYYFERKEKELRFPVGTTALSIFTLLDLYNRTGEIKYLEAAKLGGNWLQTMQKADGSMKSYKRYTGEKWYTSTQESLLYNGQVLSALSRLYRATGEEKYYNTAKKIAKRFTEKVEKEDCYLGDDYRSPNPISSAWVIMSLLDFYKVNEDEYFKNIIFNCSEDLLKRQKKDEDDIFHYGRWTRAYSSSGNGWLNEVMIEIYKFCQEQNKGDCEKYMEAAIKVTLWIIQNSYSEENTFFLKEPEKVIGGIFWDYKDKYVRTDSLCHALNAYAFLMTDLEDDFLLFVPEKPIEEILNELKK